MVQLFNDSSVRILNSNTVQQIRKYQIFHRNDESQMKAKMIGQLPYKKLFILFLMQGKVGNKTDKLFGNKSYCFLIKKHQRNQNKFQEMKKSGASGTGFNSSLSQSQYSERFSKISQKLALIPTQQEGSRANRIDIFDQRVHQLDDKFNSSIEEYNRKIAVLKDDVFRLQKIVLDNSKSFEFQIDARHKEVLSLDQKLTQKLENEIIQRRDSENKQVRYLEEKTNFLRTDISTETKIRSDILNSLNSTLEQDLPRLYELVKSEGSEREAGDSIALKKAADEIKKIHETLSTQKKNREDTETTIFEMLKELVNRIKSEIDEERKEREESQETLVTLIEDTTNKLCAAAEV